MTSASRRCREGLRMVGILARPLLKEARAGEPKEDEGLIGV